MKITLITGATGGLGKEFADLYANDKNDLLLVGTSEEKLSALKDEVAKKYSEVVVDTYACDLSKVEDMKALFSYCKEKGYFVNNLVNNAGFGDRTDFKDMDIDRQMAMLDVNCKSLLYFTRVFLTDMIEKDEGSIINVGSIAGFMSGPYMSTYHATKAFVLSLGEAIAYEIRKTKVRLLTLCPGPFYSGFVGKAGYHYTFKKLKPITARKVAEIGYKASKKGKRVKIAGFRNAVLTFLPRFVPRSFTTMCTAKQTKKEDK